jgi:hypothetical protein
MPIQFAIIVALAMSVAAIAYRPIPDAPGIGIAAAINMVQYHYDAMTWAKANEANGFTGVVPDASITHTATFTKAGPWTSYVSADGYIVTYPNPASTPLAANQVIGLRNGLVTQFDNDPGVGVVTAGGAWQSANSSLTLMPGFPAQPPSGTPSYVSPYQ